MQTVPGQWNDGESACVRFRLGDSGFGIPLSQVREIAVTGKITPVPLAPPVVRGLAWVHGQVVTLIDVSAIFGLPLPPARCREDRLMVILGGPYRHLGLYVHGPVEITRAAMRSAAPAAAPMMMVAVAGAREGAGGMPDRAAEPGEGAAASSPMVHLVSADDLFAYCDARVLEGFRRKT